MPAAAQKIFFKLVLVLFCFGVESDVVAQSGSPDRGYNPGQSYAVSDIETISMQNGNLMLNVPLASLPGGRGGTAGGVGIKYNSKLYDLNTTFIADEYADRISKSDEAGWRYTTGFSLDLDVQFNGECSGGEPHNYNIYTLSLVFPDGGKHTLHATGHSNEFGALPFFPDGRTGCQTNEESGPIIYYTADGTFARVEFEMDGDSNWANNPWTLYLADGTKVVNYAPPGSYSNNTPYTLQRVYDRNGNYTDYILTLNNSSYGNKTTAYVQDQLGRKIVIIGNYATNEDRIIADGVGGEDLVTRITWRDIEVNKTYNGCNTLPWATGCGAFTLNVEHRVIDRIYLPAQIGDPGDEDDFYWEFDYNADVVASPSYGWGEVSQVRTPTGVIAEYDWHHDNTNNLYTSVGIENWPEEKRLTYDLEYDGTTTPHTDTWTYDIDAFSGVASVTGPDGGTTTEYSEDGRPIKAVSPNGTTVEKVYAHNRAWGNYWLPDSNTFTRYEFVTIADSGGTPQKTAIREYFQDKNGNTTQVKEYDYFSYASVPRTSGRPTGLPSGASSNLKRITVSEFYNPVPDSQSTTYTDADSYHVATSKRLLRLAKNVEVQDASQSPKSRTEIDYDFKNYDSSNTKAGNPTETKVWDSFKGGVSRSYSNPLTGTNSITTSATYNDYGMPLTSTDGNDNETSITYGNVTCPGGTVTDLYPTLTVAADGSAVERTSSATYDCYTGLTTSTTDEDNDVTNSVVYDDLGRPVKSITADGTALESWTQTTYDDVNRRVIVKADLETVDDRKKVAIQHFDQLGRVRLSRSLENAAYEDPTNEQHGIKVQTRYTTNGTYSYQLSSNPYRADFSYNETDPTMGWTRSKTVNTGRHSETETFTGAALPGPWGSNTTSTGMVQTDTDANATTVTDQASKVRRSVTNALGQLTRVDEPTTSGLGTVGSPNQPTDYTYDTLGNLLQVDQGAQDRIFSYSSLSRLRSANNPESGTITYTYDNNGNLTSKYDARTITTAYVYDELNRVTARNYDDATPDVAYTYGTTTGKIGKLTKVQSTVSATEYLAFDILGRVTSHKQTTDSTDYTTGYTYNLSGALIEQAYPSGRVVKNTIDTADGSLSQVQSKRSGETYRNFANGFNYNAAGAVTSMRLGNGLWETAQFNSRLQPTQIGLGLGSATPNKLKLDYTYGTTANNGNVMSQTITVPGVTHPFVQTYTYDELNRISNAEETSNSVQTWEQTFIYDRYGNRNFDEANTTTLVKNCGSSPNFTVCAADRKIVNPGFETNNRLESDDDYVFDNAGNTTEDALGRTFVYDAENKQIQVIDNSVTVGEYSYDGDGKRIKKHVPATGELTVFIYDAVGRLIQEHSTIVQIGVNAKTVYTTNDPLGSPRINTDVTGNVISRHDYHPFGEEVTRSDYGSDTIRKQFTGYERDSETSLDFAQARMYENTLGRFTGVDIGPFTPADPQNFNRYAYVQNNPMKYIDPSGETLVILGDNAEDLVKQLEKHSGYKLKRDKKTGIVTILEGKRNEKGTSSSLADKLKEAVAPTAKVGDKTIAFSVKINAVRDAVATNVLNDSYPQRALDIDDLKVADRDAPEFAARLLGHVLEEYLQAETTFRDVIGEDRRIKSHNSAKAFESKVIGDYTGKVEKPRTDVTSEDQKTISFIYTTVRYDMMTKSGRGPGATTVVSVKKVDLQEGSKP